MNPLIEKTPATIPEPLLARLTKPEHEPRPVAPPRPPANSQNGGTPYGLAALHDECEKLADTPEGQRNDQLNRAAFRLGQLLAGGELTDPGLVEAELIAAALAAGLPADEITSTLAVRPHDKAPSGLQAGLAEPRTAPPRCEPPPNGGRLDTQLPANEEALPQAGESPPPKAPPEDEPKSKEPLLEIVSFDDEPTWAGFPDERFYVPDIVGVRQITFVVAEPKAGKSLITLDLAVALAQDRGASWPFGSPARETPIPVETGARVLFLACEDARSTVKVRRRQFLEAYGPTGDRLAIAFTRTRPLRLWNPADIDELARYVEVDGFNVVILDTLGAATGGRGDKDRDEWSEQIEPSLRKLRDKGATLILVEHERKDTGAESRAKRRPKLRKPDPHSLFGSVAKRALYASGLYLGETPWARKFQVFVETKLSDAAPWFIVERAPMRESPGWRHRYVEEVATAQADLAARAREDGDRNYQAVLDALRNDRLTYDEIAARTNLKRSTVHGHVNTAKAKGDVVEDGKKGRAAAFRAAASNKQTTAEYDQIVRDTVLHTLRTAARGRTPEEVATAVGKTRAAALRHLTALEGEGYARHSGPDRQAGTWHSTERSVERTVETSDTVSTVDPQTHMGLEDEVSRRT